MLVDTNKSLELVKSALSVPGEPLYKGITQATGLVTFDLEAPAKSLIPVITPLRNMTPRVAGKGGTGANWKAIVAINASLASAGVSEGNRGQVIATTVNNYLATYAGIGLEDFVSFEADYAAEGFTDAKAVAALNLLRSVMIQEEQIILGGNATLALGTTGTPTLVASASGGTIGASITVSVICVALTLDGYKRSRRRHGSPCRSSWPSSTPTAPPTTSASALARSRRPLRRGLCGFDQQRSGNGRRSRTAQSPTPGMPGRPAPSVSSDSRRSTRS
jgi:hypothetical protein